MVAMVRLGSQSAAMANISSFVGLTAKFFTRFKAFTAARSPMGNTSGCCKTNIR